MNDKNYIDQLGTCLHLLMEWKWLASWLKEAVSLDSTKTLRWKWKLKWWNGQHINSRSVPLSRTKQQVQAIRFHLYIQPNGQSKTYKSIYAVPCASQAMQQDSTLLPEKFSDRQTAIQCTENKGLNNEVLLLRCSTMSISVIFSLSRVSSVTCRSNLTYLHPSKDPYPFHGHSTSLRSVEIDS